MKLAILLLSLVLLVSCGNSDSQNLSKENSNESTREIASEIPSEILVTVSSKYSDQSNSTKNAIVKGSGFLVAANGKLFVVTAAHVGSGKEVEITYEGQKFSILGELYEGKYDVQVFEVHIQRETIPVTFLLNNAYIEWRDEGNVRAKWLDQFNFTLLNKWVYDPNLQKDNAFSLPRKNTLTCDLYCVFLDSPTLIQPGSSGSPLITKVPSKSEWTPTEMPYDAREWTPPKEAEGRFFVRGMAVKRERFFARSSFIPVSKIVSTILSYEKGKRTSNPEYKWNVAGSLMFRSDDDNLHESASVSSGVGNAVSIDGGNAVSIDGGNLQTFNEDDPATLLKTITSFPVLDGKSSHTWLLMMRSFEGAMISSHVWFDMEHYSALSGFIFATLPVENENRENHAGFLMYKVKKFPKDGLTYVGDKLEVEAITSEGSRLRFLLNIKGALCLDMITCSNAFEPVLEVKDDRGVYYLVDIRGLLFLNPTYSESRNFRSPAILKLEREEQGRLMSKELIDEVGTSRIFFRKKRYNKQPMTVEEGVVQMKAWVF
jgi:hypothetical protein